MRKMPRAFERATHRRTDPAYVPNVEIFDSLTHEEIHAKVQLLEPAVLATGRQGWADSAAELADAVSQAHIAIRAALTDGWRGGAAASAAAVVGVFEQSGQDLADVLAVVAQRLGQASDAAEAVRAAVAEPSAVAPDLAAALLDPNQATSNVDGQKASEHARQDAVRAMNDIYAGVFIQTGDNVPAFPDTVEGIQPESPSSTPTGPGAKISVLPRIPIETTEQSASLATTKAPTARTPDSESASAAATSAADADAGTGDASPPPPRVAQTTAETSSATALAAPPLGTGPTPTTTTAAASTVVPTAAGTGSPTLSEQERKRDERRPETPGNDAVNSLGAGAIGGLMGGALTTADTPRPGQSVAANAMTARTAHHDEDDEFDFDDLPTYLEPSDDGGELIGSLDPTTPPVVGDWTEYE
ncbi:hypothetical protein AB0C34_00245 [Nocardia sp. NPDC049220]|uniref:PPE domain-containing protein n=1 Tax=Nocardia sp. NPDC049220 TaxID=3155273 RepID=UPI0033DC772C